MEFGNINVLAVVVSALAALVVGFVWFSPPLFEKMWLAGIGKTREEVAGQSPARFLIAFVAGTLIVCAGPIGNLSDAPPRLAEALRSAAVVYAEDTRRAQVLLARLGVRVVTRSYFAGLKGVMGAA